MSTAVSIWTTSQFPYDQRLQKIRSLLESTGAEVTVWDRYLPSHPEGKIRTRRNHGPAFYAEYNREIAHLVAKHAGEVIYAADIDVMPGILWARRWKQVRKPLILDLHEWYPEVIELQGKPLKKKIWQGVEARAVSAANLVLTVNESLREIFGKKYRRPVFAVRNVPYRTGLVPADPLKAYAQRTLFYQGAINEGRGLEETVEAMKILTDWKLELVGSGDIVARLEKKVSEMGLQDRVLFRGRVRPEELVDLAGTATLGLNLLSGQSKSYYFSLANKFFDYMQSGLPSVNMDFPEYRRLLRDHPAGIMIDALTPGKIASEVRKLTEDRERYVEMRQAAEAAAEEFVWEKEGLMLADILWSDPVFRPFFDGALQLPANTRPVK